MYIKADTTILKITLPLIIIGFCLVWFASNFWCALGVTLLVIGGGIRRTN